jgi:hypothetical protein
MSRSGWESQAAVLRTPLGKVETRELKRIDHTTPTGADDGDYYMVQYDSTFANKSVIETTTPRREADGNWRVSGYYIK